MVSNQKYTGKAISMAAGILQGGVVSLLWTLLGSGLLAWMIHNEILGQDAIGYGSMIILFTASVFGSVFAYGRVKRQRVASCMYTAGLYFLMLLSMTALFFGGQYSGIGVTFLVILAGGGSVVLLGGRGNKGNRAVRKYKP